MKYIAVLLVLSLAFWTWLIWFSYHKGYEARDRELKIQEYTVSEEVQAQTRAKILNEYVPQEVMRGK